MPASSRQGGTLTALAALQLPTVLRRTSCIQHRHLGAEWVQIIVENWLVLQLSHSGLALGVTSALQFGPSVLLGMYGGVIADRHDRRRVLMITQACLGLIALVVGLLAAVGVVQGLDHLARRGGAWSGQVLRPAGAPEFRERSGGFG